MLARSLRASGAVRDPAETRGLIAATLRAARPADPRRFVDTW